MMRRSYPEVYNFVPRSFLLPAETEAFKQAIAADPKVTWICKPSMGSYGDNIELINAYDELSEDILKEEFLAQEYVLNPFLVDERKLDFRLYVVLYGPDPLTAYICDEGMTRFCTAKYQAPTNDNKKNDFMHLTNFSVNKYSPDYDESSSTFETKRSCSDVFDVIRKQYPDGDEIVGKIKRDFARICQLTVNAIHSTVR